MPKLLQLGKDLWAGILDLVYPPKCLICDSLQPRYLCADCILSIQMLGPGTCRRCGAPVEQGGCSECRGRDLHFDSVHSVAAYEDPLKEAIHLLKFSGYSCLVPELAELMVDFYKSQPRPYGMGSAEIIVPIPIDEGRKRERGFNQSELLAGHLSAAAHKPVAPAALRRVRKAPPQSSLSYEERLLNLAGAFAAGDDAVAGRKLLLVDDVYTTGSTANEAARVLKEAGAFEVHVFTLARSL